MSRTGRSSPSNPKAGRPLPPLLDASQLQAGIPLQAAQRAAGPPEHETRSDCTTTNSCSGELVPDLHRPLPALLEPSHEQRAELVFLDESTDDSEEDEDEQADGAGRGAEMVPPRIGACKYCSQNKLLCLFESGQDGCFHCRSAGRTCVDEGLKLVWGTEERNMLQEFADNPELLASFERYIDDPSGPAPANWPSRIPVLSGVLSPIPSPIPSPISSPCLTISPSLRSVSSIASISSLDLPSCSSEDGEGLPRYSNYEPTTSDVSSRSSRFEQSPRAPVTGIGSRPRSPSPYQFPGFPGPYDDRPVMNLSPPQSPRAPVTGIGRRLRSPLSSPFYYRPRRAISMSPPPPHSASRASPACSPTFPSPGPPSDSPTSPTHSPVSPAYSPTDPDIQLPARRIKRTRSNLSISPSWSSRSSNHEWWSANEEEHPDPRLLSARNSSPAHKRRRLGSRGSRGSRGYYSPASKYSPSPSEIFRKSPLGYTDGNVSSEDIMHSDEEALYLSSPVSALSIQKESSKATTSIVVTSAMTVSEVKIVLGDHGCTDLTDALDHQSCSEWAISQGGFSDIYSGKLRDGKPVAIKALRLLASSEESGKQVKHAARELHTWSKCRHPNIIELLGLVDFRGRLAMVSPWMPNGSVRLYLAAHPDADRCELCYGVSDGLAYLHESTIVHGDLKGANVLLSDQGIPKLTDFGNSALSDCSMLYTKTNSETSLSPRWTAPEIFNGGMHSYAADVFALGMTLLETLTGDIPYHDLQQDLAVIMAIGILKKLPKRPEAHIPSKSEQGDTLWSLLTKCWSYLPEDRPTAAEIRDRIKGITSQGLRC